jgi:hypothetical protein
MSLSSTHTREHDSFMQIRIRHRTTEGTEAFFEPRQLRGAAVEAHPPLSLPHAHRGRGSIVTHWSPSYGGPLVPCASSRQLSAAVLLDFDPHIERFAASSLEIQWTGQAEHGTVTPAFMARTVYGERLLLPEQHVGSNDLAAQAVQQAATQAHWSVRPLQVPDPVLLGSLWRAAHYRACHYADPHAAPLLLQAFTRPLPLAAGIARAGGIRPQMRSLAWHLLWHGHLAFDHTRPLTPASLVWTAPKEHA